LEEAAESPRGSLECNMKRASEPASRYRPVLIVLTRWVKLVSGTQNNGALVPRSERFRCRLEIVPKRSLRSHERLGETTRLQSQEDFSPGGTLSRNPTEGVERSDSRHKRHLNGDIRD